jgi:uncharacterized iron-regulated protein
MKKILLVLLVSTSFLLQGQQTILSDSAFEVYGAAQKKICTLEDIVDVAKNYDVIFFGEEHNDSIGHRLEILLLEKLTERYKDQIALSLEMFDRDVQPVMNEYLGGFLKEKTFVKDARTWSNYRDYRPMIEFCKTHQTDVICANAAGRYSNLAGRKGQLALQELPLESKHFFAPLPYDTARGEYYRKLMEMSGHSTSLTDTAKHKAPAMPMGSFSLVTAQSLWDATMAYSIAEYRRKKTNKKILQVNGRFHSDERFAIVEQLKKYNPATRVMVVSSGSDDSFGHTDWEKFRKLGDYIIITNPRIPRTFAD